MARSLKVGDFVSSSAHGFYAEGKVVSIDGAYVMIETKTKGVKHHAEYYLNELRPIHWARRKRVEK